MESKLENLNKNLTINFTETDNLLKDTCEIINHAQDYAYHAINTALVERNWLLGYRIAKEELKGQNRADYGKEIIKNLSKELTEIYGKGFDRSNLYFFLQFYKSFPNIVDTACRQSVRLLSWSHYRVLLTVNNKEARDWYLNEATNEVWSVRQLQRNVESQYYFRLLKTPNRLKKKEKRNKKERFDKTEFIKNPVIAEFLGLPSNHIIRENDLETTILNNLQHFMTELGKGYAFVARQQHIKTEKEDYYIDLVFYNYILKCFVLIDLKMNKITHQDVGQMDMYIRMYDELRKQDDDNPTIGIVLCSETDEDIARFSVLNGNEQLFATKYMLYMPDLEELKEEIEKEKTIYYLEQKEKSKIDEKIK